MAMDIQTKPDLYRFAYTFNQLFDNKEVTKIAGDSECGYKVMLAEDAEYQDVGTAIGEAFVKAGYALVGVHQHYTDGDSIDALSFAEIEHVSETPVPDYFMGDLHFDQERGVFQRLEE